MAFVLTERARIQAEKVNVEPQIILQIDGVDTLFGARIIRKYAQYGDDIYYGDEGLVYGGFIELENQSTLISFQDGTTSTIRQILNTDTGKGESIQSMQIAMIDKDFELTKLLTPGEVVEDILGRRCRLWSGFPNTVFPDDYIVIFRGLIDNPISSPTIVTLNIVHPDVKKRSELFTKIESKVANVIDNSQTTIQVQEAAQFVQKITGPDASIDPNFKTYIRINDEVIEYETITGGDTFSGCTRGALGTTAASHAVNDTVSSYYLVQGNVIDIALKLMASRNGDYLEELQPTNFVRISSTSTVSNSIFFANLDLEFIHNVRVGDYVTTSGASNGANNVSLKRITAIEKVELGSYIVIDGVSFVEELATSGLVSFRSFLDVWPIGMAMHNDEIDIRQHEIIRDTFLPSFDYRFYIDEGIDGRTFLHEQIYQPASLFSLPRKAQASVGYHVGPLPTENVKIMDTSVVKNPSKLKIERSTSKNFYNSIFYKYNSEVLETSKLTRGVLNTSATSLARIPVGNKVLNIEAKGMRDDLQAVSSAKNAGDRRLKKYRFGAEYIRGIEVLYGFGFDVEIGDIMLVEIESLKVSDIQTGTRSGEPRLFQVDNKSWDIRKGNIVLDIVDTSFDKDARYCLMSPSSYVKIGIDESSFIIEASFDKPFADNEYKKWEKWIGNTVIVRNADSSILDSSVLQSLSGNQVNLATPLSFIPSNGMILEFASYNSQTIQVTTIYGSMTDNATFDDGKGYYVTI